MGGGGAGGAGGATAGGTGGTSLGGDGGEAGAPHVPNKCEHYATLPSDCKCVDDATHAYLFCSMTRPFSAAASQCSFREMHLVKLEGPDEDAWILQEAGKMGMPSLIQYFWIGASTIKTPGVWHWTDLSVFWQGGANGNAYPGAYFNWRTDSPQNTATESCAYTDQQGWQDGDCTQNRPYVCEAE